MKKYNVINENSNKNKLQWNSGPKEILTFIDNKIDRLYYLKECINTIAKFDSTFKKIAKKYNITGILEIKKSTTLGLLSYTWVCRVGNSKYDTPPYEDIEAIETHIRKKLKLDPTGETFDVIHLTTTTESITLQIYNPFN